MQFKTCTITRVRSIGGEPNKFAIIAGLRQVSTLRSYLFTLVIDDITRHIQEVVPWCLLFADLLF